MLNIIINCNNEICLSWKIQIKTCPKRRLFGNLKIKAHLYVKIEIIYKLTERMLEKYVFIVNLSKLNNNHIMWN